MATMTRKDLKEIEDYYFRGSYKNWCPFPEELRLQLLAVYGQEPTPHCWTEQDIFEGSRKIIKDYFNKSS
jgi:hypothetical protein